jgi:hypothetical protein
MGANKVLVLSVPLEGGRAVKMNIKDLKIASRESWQRIHWRSIHDSYRKAPWFEEYAPWLEKLYGQSYTYLWDLNVKIMEWILQALKWNAVILAENEILNAFSLSKKNDNPGWVGKDGFPEYQQVFSNRLGFQPDLSVLDLILNEGPSAAQYLQKLSDYAVRISGKDPV